MATKKFENCTVLIENDRCKKKIYLEETTDIMGKVIKYEVKKEIEYKLPSNFEETKQ